MTADAFYARLCRPGLYLVEANAGTGKTQALVSICLQALAEGRVRADEMVMVTFTRAAAEQLRQRTETMLRQVLSELQTDPEGAIRNHPWLAQEDTTAAGRNLQRALNYLDETLIQTLDSLFLRILNDYHMELNLPPDIAASARPENLQAACLEWWREHAGSIDRLQTFNYTVASGQKNTRTPQLLAAAMDRWRTYCGGIPRILEIPPLPDSHKADCSDWRNYCNGILKIPEQISEDTAATLQEMVDRGHLLDSLSERIAQIESRQWQLHGRADFAEVTTHLYSQLHRESSTAQALRTAIRQRWKMVVVDESQDNNGMQFDILRRLFEPDRTEADRTLIFIGDPKQSIYSFRGGDLAAWFRMCSYPNAQHLPLPAKNWRSNVHQVQAVNCLFGGGQDGDNPFNHPREDANQPDDAATIAWQDSTVPERDARAPDESCPPSLVVDGQLEDGLSIRVVGTGLPDESAVIQACAREIATLIRQGKAGSAVLQRRDSKTPLQANDLAVLVNTNDQASRIRSALLDYGIFSLLQDQQKVTKSPEADWLLYLMRAMLRPRNPGILRTAMLTPLINRAPDTEPEQLASTAKSFAEYGRIWQQNGLETALLILLKEQKAPLRLLRELDGQRSLTNLIHLGELLTKKAEKFLHPETLIRQLEEMIASDLPDEEQEIRLETDQNAVRISTIHKSKGLEYPVVFLPFVWQMKLRGLAKKPTLPMPIQHRNRNLHRERYLAILPPEKPGFFSGETLLKDAGTEATDETVRQIYVALTRAMAHTRIFWPEHTAMHASENAAVARCLDFVLDEKGALNVDTDALIARRSDQSIRVLAAQQDASVEYGLPQPEIGTARVFRGRVYQTQAVSNYTGISATLSRAPVDSDLIAEQKDHDQLVQTAEDSEVHSAEVSDIAAFPAGSAVGTFFHQILEKMVLEKQLCASVEDLTGLCANAMQADAFMQEHARLAPVAGRALYDTARAIFPGTDFCLADLEDPSRGRVLSELEFEFPLAPQWHRILAQSTTAEFRPGFMKGFIDLVMAWDGRYYIADLKSNFLGASDANYLAEALQTSARAHHYDLQLKIYSLVLHRHLKNHLPDYDYERHFGGGFLIFLRGVREGMHRGIWPYRLSEKEMEEMDTGVSGHV